MLLLYNRLFMTNEVFRGNLSDIAKIYTTAGFSKASQANKELDSQKILYINKRVVRDGIQARTGNQHEDYSYIVVSADDRLDTEYLAFLINSSPWRIMLGDGSKFLDGTNIPTSLGSLKKLPVVLLNNKEQSACSFLNTVITTTYDAIEKNEEVPEDIKKAYRFLWGIRDYIALEILLDGVLSSPDISVLAAWVEKKSNYDSTPDKKEALVTLLKSVFSSNDELRDRMNKMRLYIDENTEAVFNNFPK